jgi:hypothetical protein
MLVIIGCAGCAASGQTTRSVPTVPTVAVSAQQQCVQAVFTVLSGMVSRPYDNRPFEDFVTRYGTDSVTYSAYRDTFTSFYDLSASQGIRGAENRLRASITEECASAR